MPEGRPNDEFLGMQKNARKGGTLFNNMFLLKVVEFSSELGKEKPYILGLQSELPCGKDDLPKLASHLDELDARMAKVKRELASLFYLRSTISRQAHQKSARPIVAQSEDENQTPQRLYSAFSATEVQPWNQGSFQRVKKLADASRNKGVVWLMKDKAQKMVAVKQMPSKWVKQSHDEFLQANPNETELPWQDIGCTRYLNSLGYQFACSLYGVYRDREDTFVVSEFASEGDLLTAATTGKAPGPDREQSFAPLVLQLFSALQHLHELQIVHRDVSLENILLNKGNDGKASIKLIDFGMASTQRKFKNCPRGKQSYEAPEMTTGEKRYDAFLSDAFAAGVAVYGMVLKDYPWMSTKAGKCQCFDYVSIYGFRAYCAKRSARGGQKRIADCLSEGMMALLEGLLSISPANRLTLGEKQFSGRRSVWDEPWVKGMKNGDL